MKFNKIALATAFAALLSLPAAAQTTQTSPSKPTTSMPAQPPANATKSTTPNAALIDINSASSEDLEKLPGIGKARAAAIIKNRPYKGKDDLVNKHVIPSNLYKGISDKIIARQG